MPYDRFLFLFFALPPCAWLPVVLGFGNSSTLFSRSSKSSAESVEGVRCATSESPSSSATSSPLSASESAGEGADCPRTLPAVSAYSQPGSRKSAVSLMVGAGSSVGWVNFTS